METNEIVKDDDVPMADNENLLREENELKSDDQEFQQVCLQRVGLVPFDQSTRININLNIINKAILHTNRVCRNSRSKSLTSRYFARIRETPNYQIIEIKQLLGQILMKKDTDRWFNTYFERAGIKLPSSTISDTVTSDERIFKLRTATMRFNVPDPRTNLDRGILFDDGEVVITEDDDDVDDDVKNMLRDVLMLNQQLRAIDEMMAQLQD